MRKYIIRLALFKQNNTLFAYTSTFSQIHVRVRVRISVYGGVYRSVCYFKHNKPHRIQWYLLNTHTLSLFHVSSLVSFLNNTNEILHADFVSAYSFCLDVRVSPVECVLNMLKTWINERIKIAASLLTCFCHASTGVVCCILIWCLRDYRVNQQSKQASKQAIDGVDVK